MSLQSGSSNSVDQAVGQDSIFEQSVGGAIQVFSQNSNLLKEEKNVFLYESSPEQLNEFRRLFIQNLNEGRYFYPVPEGSDQAVLFRKDIEIESPGVISDFLSDAANGAEVGAAAGAGIGLLVGGPAGAGVGAAVGGAYGVLFVVGTYIGEAIFQNRVDPFVANIYLFDKILLNNEDITDYVLDYSQSFITGYSNWTTGPANDRAVSTVAFLDDEVFSPKLLDANNQVVDKIFGTDAFILNNSQGKSLGFVVYNDPAITGREVSVTDDLQIDFSKVGAVSGDTVSLIGLPVTVSELFSPRSNASLNDLVRLIPNFGNDVIQGFLPGRDILQLETNLTFADFDTNGDDILTPADATVSLLDNDLVLDVSKAAGLEAGLSTITLTDVTELPKQSTNFSEDVSGKPVIDLRSYSGEIEVEFDAIRNKNTLYDSLIGFYQISDSRGGIDTSGDGIADLHPGDSGYAAAAVQNREENIIIKGSTKFTAELEGGNIYAPFIAVNANLQNITSANIYFGFSKANPDGRSHVQLSGSNVLNFEDLLWLGDRSFNDMVVAFTVPSS